MEVLGALASSMQLIGQCGQITLQIIAWVESVRTVDQRINEFVREVCALRETYDGLNKSLQNPLMLEAARTTNMDAGGHLWTQLSNTLDDCKRTMSRITEVLQRIDSSSSVLRPCIKQLRESLYGGDLVRLREQIQLFNSSLQLPLQMITLTIQLRQSDVTARHQVHISSQLEELKVAIQQIQDRSQGFIVPTRQRTLSGTTVLSQPTPDDQLIFKNMNSYVGHAKRFLDSASVAASTLSAMSVNHATDQQGQYSEGRRGSTFAPLTDLQFQNITTFVQNVPAALEDKVQPLADSASETEVSQFGREEAHEVDDTDLELLQAYLGNGHTEFDKGEFEAAGENFAEALALSQEVDFGSAVALSPADIMLLLGECLVKQDRHDEAITLLSGLALQAKRRPTISSAASIEAEQGSLVDQKGKGDEGQALAACHLLGLVYLKRIEYAQAENHADRAFRGRRKLLGDHHQTTIASVRLLIDIFEANGQSVKAKAHERFLSPVKSDILARPSASSPVATQSPPSSPALHPPHLPNPEPARQHRFMGITMPFRRTERNALSPISSAADQGGEPSSSKMERRVTEDSAGLSVTQENTSYFGQGQYPSAQHKSFHGRVESLSSSGIPIDHASSCIEVSSSTGANTISSSTIHLGPALYAAMSPNEMHGKFSDIALACKNGKGRKAAEKALSMLKHYDPDGLILNLRANEIQANIRASNARGLAGTGAGFAPIHFFCSLKYEPIVEVDILLRSKADANAIAYRAGYGPAKVSPFTPLSLAVDRGHRNIVHLLLDAGASWNAQAMRPERRFASDRDTIHPLLQACSNGYTAIVTDLIKHGIKLTETCFPRSWHGNTLLHQACHTTSLPMVKVLMDISRSTLPEQQFDFIGKPGQRDHHGVTPLMFAVDLRDCADPNFRARKLRDRIQCLRILLGVDHDVTDDETDEGAVVVDHPRSTSPGRLAFDLNVADNKGNTLFWYADDGDAELRAFLENQSQRSRLIDI